MAILFPVLLQHSEQEVETILDKSLILFRYLQDKVLRTGGEGGTCCVCEGCGGG